MHSKHEILEQTAEMMSGWFTEREEQRAFRAGVDPVRVGQPIFDEREVLAVVETLLDGWLGASRRAGELEQKLADYLGASATKLLCSGSSANLAAVSALVEQRQLRPGDEVITAALTFPTTVAAILKNGLTPVLVDAVPGLYVMDTAELERALSPKVKGILAVHVLGNPVDMASVNEFARQHDLFVLEDACDGTGASFGEKKIGALGDMGTFSFYASHHITMGEGGAIAFQDPDMAGLLISLRDWGRASRQVDRRVAQGEMWRQRFRADPDPFLDWYDQSFIYTTVGYNFRITELQAAMGLVQLERLDGFLQARWANYQRLYSALAPFEEFLILPSSHPQATPAWLMFPITVRATAPFERRDLVAWLESRMIETRPVLASNVLRQPGYRDIGCRTVGSLAGADEVMQRSFSIGLHPGLGKEQLDFVTSAFREFFQQQGLVA